MGLEEKSGDIQVWTRVVDRLMDHLKNSAAIEEWKPLKKLTKMQ